MPDLIQLDAAAKMVGKSEVTLRRLVKAGKVKAHKEKTLTGFIYLVDANEVKAYYSGREGEWEAPTPDPEPPKPEHQNHAVHSNGKMRIAVSDETGNPIEYWVKRSEAYEEKYHQEVRRHIQLREELGLWRGRAEHAQAMLMKLLPAPTTVEVASNATQTPVAPQKSQLITTLVILQAVIIVAIIAGVFYFTVLR